MRSERVIAYLDGINLYHELMDAKMGSSRWLDPVAMSQSLLGPNQQLVLLRYFTTRIHNRPDKADRQSTYIDALETRGGLECQGTATSCQQLNRLRLVTLPRG